MILRIYLGLGKRLMFKIKHCLIPLVGIVISFSSVNAATKTDQSVADMEQDLLKVVAMLGDEKIAEASKILTQTSLKKTQKISLKPAVVNPTTEFKDLVGLNLQQFLNDAEPKVKKAAEKKPQLAKSTKYKGISKSTYQKVMALSTGRTRRASSSRYRPCYKFNYQELQNRSRRYQNSITEASRQHGVNENLIKSVITAESCFKVRARSHKGARGLMQLMPATARRFGVRNSYNSHQNIGAGTKYLRWLLDRFNGNVHFALAGYNAGEGKVDRYGGIPPYKETREYVRRVMGVYNTLHGKKDRSANMDATSNVKSRAYYQRVWLNKQKAKQRVKPMNQRRCIEAAPGHLRSITYLKRSGRGGATWRRYYRLKQAENLDSITRKTGVHINALKRLNRLPSYTRLKAGQQLVVWECRA